MLRLEVRPQPSARWGYASPLLALAITVVIGVILFAVLGKDPVRGLQVFFWEPIKSTYALSELMVKATPLLIIALGLAVCFRSNVWNIGAEGQYIVGAICAGGVALTADAGEHERTLARQAGMDDFITKPIDANRLLQVAARFTERPNPATFAGE